MRGVNNLNIESLHGTIVRAIRNTTGAILEITSSSHPRSWRTVTRNTEVTFELNQIPDRDPRILCDYVERDLGGRTFVFRVFEQPDDEPTLWAGWYESWKSNENAATFDLVGLSWTFYWGILSRPRPVILRAEWDALRHRSQRAAQPHWHINPELLVASYRPISGSSVSLVSAGTDLLELTPVIEQGLEEITQVPTGIQELSMTGMHLAMGGWHHPGNHPNCWRREIPGTWNEITTWSERTLVYAKEQFTDEFSAREPFDFTLP